MICKHPCCNKETPHMRCLKHRMEYNDRYRRRKKDYKPTNVALEKQLARCADDCARRLLLGVSEKYDVLERVA